MNRGLEQVKNTLEQALNHAGLQTRSSYEPGKSMHYDTPVAAVGLRTGESHSASLGRYLGQQWNGNLGESVEVYGMELELEMSLDLYAPPALGAAGCDAALETAHQVLLQGLPTGIRPMEFKWDAVVWDPETEMFLRKGNLCCTAYFFATTTEEGMIISDFILKGTVVK